MEGIADAGINVSVEPINAVTVEPIEERPTRTDEIINMALANEGQAVRVPCLDVNDAMKFYRKLDWRIRVRGEKLYVSVEGKILRVSTSPSVKLSRAERVKAAKISKDDAHKIGMALAKHNPAVVHNGAKGIIVYTWESYNKMKSCTNLKGTK